MKNGKKKNFNQPKILKNTWISHPSTIKKKKINCYSLLQSVSLIWQLSGNFPVIITGKYEFEKYQFSWSLLMYNIILFGSCCGFFIKSIDEWKELLSYPVPITGATMAVQSLSALLSMLIMICIWWYYRKDFIDAVDFLILQDINLLKIGYHLDYMIVDRIIKAYVYGTFFITTGICCFGYYASVQIYSRGNYKLSEAISWIFWTIPKMFQVLSTTPFVCLVFLLANHFSALNEQLKIIVKNGNAMKIKIIDTPDTIIESIRTTAQIHYNLCKISKFFNKQFNGILVMAVSTAFPILSAAFYFIFVEIQGQNDTDYIRIGVYGSWQIIHAYPIIIIVIACNWASNQASYTGQLIHEIEVEKTNTKLYQIIRSFSLQLHHQKVEFSGARLFPLNSKLLQTMIAHVTTSLVILIQFQPKIE